MKAMRIIVTGSRDWDDQATIHAVLDRMWFTARDAGERLIVAHGGARGADQIAHGWARRRVNAGWAVEAQAKGPDYKRYGKAAPHVRNAEMVRLGADMCIAFINLCADRKCHKPMPHGSHGAVSTAKLADGEGIRLQRIGPGADCPADWEPSVERSSGVSDGA